MKRWWVVFNEIDRSVTDWYFEKGWLLALGIILGLLAGMI